MTAPVVPGPARLSRGRRVLFTAVVTIAFLGALELAARGVEILRPPRAVDFGAGFDPASRVFVPSSRTPGFVETAPAKRLVFREQSFAARKFDGTLRVAIVGGSSVNYLDEELRVLRRDLRRALAPRWKAIETINAGGLSYGSGRLVRVTAEILGYGPDVVVFYEANNEFEEALQRERASLDSLEVRRTTSRFALARLVGDLVAGEPAERTKTTTPAPDAKTADVPEERPPDLARTIDVLATREEAERRMEAYRDNLRFIVRSCRAHGVPVILCTVPSNLVKPQLGAAAKAEYAPVEALFAAGRWEEAAALGRKALAGSLGRHQASDVENGIVRQVAEEESVPLADVEAAVIAAEPHGVPGETLFVDHCHLGSQGNAIFRETIARSVIRALGGGADRIGR